MYTTILGAFNNQTDHLASQIYCQPYQYTGQILKQYDKDFYS